MNRAELEALTHAELVDMVLDLQKQVEGKWWGDPVMTSNFNRITRGKQQDILHRLNQRHKETREQKNNVYLWWCDERQNYDTDKNFAKAAHAKFGYPKNEESICNWQTEWKREMQKK